jgi:hypothetical protein
MTNNDMQQQQQQQPCKITTTTTISMYNYNNNNIHVRPREKVCHRFGYMYNYELYFIENNTKITVKTWYGPLLQQ